MPGLALNLLGPVAVTVDDRPFDGLHIRPTVALCVYLACRPEPHHREHLMALLWPDWPSAAAHKNLRQNLYTLRQALPSVAARDGNGQVPLVLAGHDTLQLNPEAAVDLDVSRFRTLLRQDTPEAASAAVTLYRGDFLADFYLPDSASFEEWAASLRADLRREMQEALERLAGYALEQFDYGLATDYSRRQLAMDDLCESAHRRLMRLLALSGHREQALAQYKRCVELLQTDLQIEPSTATRELARRIAGGDADLMPPTAGESTTLASAFAPAPRHNLPLQLTSFIGRQREIAAVQRLLDASRLVTLTGAGGCGKSRLALAVAGDVLEGYADGVWRVEFAPLDNPEFVAQTVAYALGLRDESGRTSQEALTDYLRSRNTLLVLDNCEHLVGACAGLAEALLRACSRLRILATSREVLAVPGETLYVVPSLQMPEPDQPPDEMAEVESVRLFVERATAGRPGFELTAGNAAAVAQICRRLDGVPLAIELAAARVRFLSAAQVAERLDDRFRLLTGGSRTLLPRHQTLRTTIDWSYNLLSEPEQRLFRRLAVFHGGWTLEAAEAVCAGENLPQAAIIDLLGRLVDKSLLMTRESDGCVRFSRLETIRQYGCEKLLESGEGDWARRRHLDYFLHFAERGERESHGPRSLEWKRRMDAERNNLRAALEYDFSAEGASDAVVRLARTVGEFNGVWATGSWKEGLYWTEKAMAHPNAVPPTALRASLLFLYTIFDKDGPWERHRSQYEESLAIYNGLGEAFQVERAYLLLWLGFQLSYQLGERELGTRHMQEAIRVFEESGDKWGLGFALNLFAGVIIELDNDFNGAWAVTEKGLEVARQTGEQFLIAVLTDDLGYVNVRHGRYREGQDYLEEALVVYHRFEAWAFACQSLKWRGDAARGLNDYGKAEGYYRASLTMTQDIGWVLYGIGVQMVLGLTVLHQGDVKKAVSWFTEAMEVAHETSNSEFPRFVAFHFLDCMASALSVQGKADAASHLFGAFDAQLEAFLAEGFTRERLFDAIDLQEHEHFLALCRGQLDETTFGRCWQEGRALRLEEAVELGLQQTRTGVSLPAAS